jgi:hypothetical protein
MLHLVFLCKDRSETNDFDIMDDVTKLWKLIHRHPHIYSDTVKQ